MDGVLFCTCIELVHVSSSEGNFVWETRKCSQEIRFNTRVSARTACTEGDFVCCTCIELGGKFRAPKSSSDEGDSQHECQLACIELGGKFRLGD